MCCFSQPVRRVSKTRILARPVFGDRQLLVYSMNVLADADLAMVLPIPVPPRSGEDAVRFVDMSSSRDFFDQINALFPPEMSRGEGAFGAPPPQRANLVVHNVGDFEASFVPSRAEFARLDPRFQLPANVWDALPGYADWGFCVFKLRVKPTASEFHPMAFDFPRRVGTRIFFPSVHVHDGRVHPRAAFDHALYCQLGPVRPGNDWMGSLGPADNLHGNAKQWLDPSAFVYKRTLQGDLPNADVYVPEAP